MNLYEKPSGLETRWYSPENPDGARGKGGLVNGGSKGRPFVSVPAGETFTLMDVRASGIVRRMWITINDRSPEMLRSLRIDITWDDASRPAVSVPFGDFFGIGLGRRIAFENALFSDPEGRSFNCFIPMPFRTGARITVTNESDRDLPYFFYDVDITVGEEHPPEALYFHAHWRRESPNALGKEYRILPRVAGSGRFLGCNIGVITDPRYGTSWWGEGEVKVRLANEDGVTLCGTGTEDYIGTAWGQGFYIHRTQGCSIADSERGQWAFYRYHVDDPVFFDEGAEVSIQTIGGTSREKVTGFLNSGVPALPTTVDGGPGTSMTPLLAGETPIDLRTVPGEAGWVNFWREDDWSSVAYFYLDQAETDLPDLPPATFRAAGLAAIEASERADV